MHQSPEMHDQPLPVLKKSPLLQYFPTSSSEAANFNPLERCEEHEI
jgi:hypothetical protein